jgi:NAD-dependent dihydropyrimidine dehydrogenase PreA subunit
VTYVIGQPCIDVIDRACVEECPVDCIYEGGRSLYIHPDECVDCGACEPVCPVEAIYYEDDLPAALTPYLEDNARFFTEPLPGRAEPLGSPGGAAKLGPLGVDTGLVASHPEPDPDSGP